MIINVNNANNCWHFNIYEHDKFHSQLSRVWKEFYKLGARSDKILCFCFFLSSSYFLPFCVCLSVSFFLVITCSSIIVYHQYLKAVSQSYDCIFPARKGDGLYAHTKISSVLTIVSIFWYKFKKILIEYNVYLKNIIFCMWKYKKDISHIWKYNFLSPVK